MKRIYISPIVRVIIGDTVKPLATSDKFSLGEDGEDNVDGNTSGSVTEEEGPGTTGAKRYFFSDDWD